MSLNEPHPGHSDCSEVLHRIYEYLDGEMTAGDVARVAAHLQACQPCLGQHDLEQAMKRVVRRSLAPEPAPQALRMQIVTRITTFRLELGD